jgi:predicted enzyme related to lactoylglutathione lyase
MEEAPTMATETKPVTATATHTVCHLEIPAKDPDKLATFYSSLFGWQFEGAPGMPEYKMALMAGGDNACGVAVYTPPPEDSHPQPRNYISVESIGAYTQKLEELGGKVLHRFTVTGMGYGAIGLDPEGNSLSLWEQDESAKE